MGVVSIDSRMPFKFCGPRDYERVPEGLKFFCGAALTLWAPLLIYCSLTGQFPLLCLMICNQSLGVMLGVLMHNEESGSHLSCIPLDRDTEVLSHEPHGETKKAA